MIKIALTNSTGKHKRHEERARYTESDEGNHIDYDFNNDTQKHTGLRMEREKREEFEAVH